MRCFRYLSRLLPCCVLEVKLGFNWERWTIVVRCVQILWNGWLMDRVVIGMCAQPAWLGFVLFVMSPIAASAKQSAMLFLSPRSLWGFSLILISIRLFFYRIHILLMAIRLPCLWRSMLMLSFEFNFADLFVLFQIILFSIASMWTLWRHNSFQQILWCYLVPGQGLYGLYSWHND